MTDQLRKAALDFLRLAIRAPKDHGHYAIDSGGEIYWYEERPSLSLGSPCWAEKQSAYEMQKILHWDSLLFSAEEVASRPAEPPQSAPAPNPKMGRFDMERFKAGELAYRESDTYDGRCATYRYIGTFSDGGRIACVRTWDGCTAENLVEMTRDRLCNQTKMPVKTKKVYIQLWKYDEGACKLSDSELEVFVSDVNVFPLGCRNNSKTLIEIIEREVEV